MAEQTRRRTVFTSKKAALAILPFLPLLYLVALIARYGVDVPFADEFTFAPLLEKAHAGTLTVADLFAQHNEHRYFFTRLLFIGLAFAFQGNLRAEMFFSVFLALLAGANLWWLLRKTAISTSAQTLLLCLFSLLLFSPVQAENWIWGFQFPLFFCNFLFTCGLVAAFSGLNPGKKFALCGAIALIASFSFGGGVLLWVLTFPLGLLIHREITWKTMTAWLVAWGAVAAATMALYFFHYVKPPYHPHIAASRNPVDYFLYVTTFLGAHLSRAARSEPIFQAALVGTVLLVLWSVAVAYAFRHRQDFELRRRILPWVALGSYAILNAVLAAAARIGFGVSQALDSRYTSFSLYLGGATAALIVILKHEVYSRTASRRFEGAIVRLETILLTAFAVLTLTAFSWGRSFMIESQGTRLWGKGALLFSNVMETGEIHDRYLMANAPEARAYANTLDKIGLLHPSMLRTAEIAQLKTKQHPDLGFVDFITTAGSSCSVVGWAILPGTSTRAHCVILSYEDPARGAVAFRVADEIHNRPDVAAVLKKPAAEASGWTCHFDRSILPAGDIVVSAWAMDANHAILYQLGTPKLLH
ncbi:MAG TPA: hypothetical protein VM940_01240 [Chthoniobacterales bacterium]|jgi:hypothetical protein|nr:hypothetical protein [Chthoniobacterales bacterium]